MPAHLSPDGETMTDGLLNIDSTGITGHANLGWGYSYLDRADGMPANRLRVAIGLLPIAAVIVAAGLFVLTVGREQVITGASRMAVAAQAKSAPVTIGLAKEPSFDPTISEAVVPDQPAPIDRLTISSQS